MQGKIHKLSLKDATMRMKRKATDQWEIFQS
jgi:hypothetical protein